MYKLKDILTENLQRIHTAIGIINAFGIPPDKDIAMEIEQELITRKAIPIQVNLAKFIQKHGTINHRKLLQNCSRYNASDILEATLSLKECGMIEIKEEGSRGKKVYVWVGGEEEIGKPEVKIVSTPSFMKR